MPHAPYTVRIQEAGEVGRRKCFGAKGADGRKNTVLDAESLCRAGCLARRMRVRHCNWCRSGVIHLFVGIGILGQKRGDAMPSC